MNGTEQNLTLSKKQEKFIAHYLSSPSIDKACKKAGISRTTFYTWLGDETFKEKLKKEQDWIIKGAMDNLKLSLTKAVDGLIELMKSEQDTIKRYACRDIIEYAFKAIENYDLEERLKKVERIVLERRTYR